jgi:transcription initiation factor TFIID subunit 5
MIVNGFSIDGETYFKQFKAQFESIHSDELQALQTVTLPQHAFDNAVAKLYRENKYRIPLNTNVYFNLITFLETSTSAKVRIIGERNTSHFGRFHV